MPLESIAQRIVKENECELWPGSYVAHPIAFLECSADGVDIWR